MRLFSVATLVVAFSAGGGVAGLALAWHLRRHLGRSGAGWFAAAFLVQATWCLTYAVAILVEHAGLRRLLAGVTLGATVLLGPVFLGFALVYTGRRHLVRTPAYLGALGVGVLTAVGAVTDPAHGLVFVGYRPEPTLGLATVRYGLAPLGIAGMIVGIVGVGVAVVLLVDTVLSYGPLYRREAAAVAVSTIPPSVALLVYLFGLGPYPAVNLAPAAFVVHSALDAYAFVGRGMFQTSPTTRRAAERGATDDLDTPVVVVDTRDVLVVFNDAAGAALGLDEAALGRGLAAVSGLSTDALATSETVSPRASPDRSYAPTVSELTDPADTVVGRTVVLQDVTERERREERLAVLNRVLRHNLRNELTVVDGYAGRLAATAEDEDRAAMAGAVRESAAELLRVAETVRDFEAAGTGPVAAAPVDVEALLGEVADTVREAHPDAAVSVATELPADVTVVTDRERLALVLRNLADNGARHHPGAATVTLEARVEADTLVVTVTDDGPGVPEAELAPVRSGAEDALDHGSGAGLWVVWWTLTTLGGEVAFAVEDGTRATVRLPATVRR